MSFSGCLQAERTELTRISFSGNSAEIGQKMPFPVERVEETRPSANTRVGRDMRDAQENDFCVELTPSRHDFCVSQLVSKGSVPFAWSMNEGSPQRCRIEDINGLIRISFLGDLCRLEARE